jgi:hypothetical protein
MLQGRSGPGAPWTSPFRDITYLFPEAARNSFEEFEQLLPHAAEVCDKMNITNEEICAVAKEMSAFIKNVHDDKQIKGTNDEVIETISGLFLRFSDQTPLNARMVFAYFFLRQMAYNFAVGVRNVTHVGQNDAPDFSAYISKFEHMRLGGWKAKLKAIWRIIRQK